MDVYYYKACRRWAAGALNLLLALEQDWQLAKVANQWLLHTYLSIVLPYLKTKQTGKGVFTYNYIPT